MENSPDELVVVPREVPFMATDAPLNGVPLASEILPLTGVCANKPDEKNSNAISNKGPFAIRERVVGEFLIRKQLVVNGSFLLEIIV
jgi:hypothetical protein